MSLASGADSGAAALTGVLLTLPALAALAATMLYPIAWTVWLSLNGKNYALTGTPDFVGLANYLRILGQRGFPRRRSSTRSASSLASARSSKR